MAGGSAPEELASATSGWIGDDQLTPNSGKISLKCGDVLRLGELKVTFFTPAGLHEFLTNATDLVS